MHIKIRGARAMLYRSSWVPKGTSGNTHGYAVQQFAGSLPRDSVSLPSDLENKFSGPELQLLETKLFQPARQAAQEKVREAEHLESDPIWRLDKAARLTLEAAGLFGLVPHWAKDLTVARRTYNARSETVAEKPSFRDAWLHGHRCIIPCECIFEPNWETGKPVRWRIERKDSAPMGVAGLWGSWATPDGRELLSFTMLTINAAGHEVMQQFHKPEDEKRMPGVDMYDPVDPVLLASWFPGS